MLHMKPRRRLHISILALLTSVGAMAAPKSEVPIATGVTFVIAVSNAPEHPGVRDRVDTAHGDYETIVTITSVEPDGVSQSAFIDAFDGKGVRRQVTVSRRVRRNDLATASLQVLGFRSSDPPNSRLSAGALDCDQLGPGQRYCMGVQAAAGYALA